MPLIRLLKICLMLAQHCQLQLVLLYMHLNISYLSIFRFQQYLIVTYPTNIKSSILKLNSSSTVGIDAIEIIVTQFFHLVPYLLETDIFPSALTISKVIQIFNKFNKYK